ncbi:MAG: alpha/beta hydrolase [Pseudomonadota bacterium]
MAQVKRLFVDGLFGQTHVRIARPDVVKHPPFVCLHMFPQSGRNFAKFVAAASTDRVVLAPDFPGHGESDSLDTPIAAEDYARSIWAAVDRLGTLEQTGQVDLFGIHAGAKLAVEAACQRPQHVRKIVLSSAAVLNPDDVAEFREAFSPKPLDEAGTRFTHWWALITQGRKEYMTLETCAEAFAEVLRGGEKYEWGHAAVFDYNLRFPRQLKSLTQPVALLNPKDELYEKTLRTLDYLKDVQLFDLPHWSHGYIESFPHEVADLVCGWLDDARPDTRTATARPVVSNV